MRRQLQKESAKTPNGAAFRWAVGAAPNGFLELQLQSLPLPAALVNGKPMLRQDDIAVVVIKAWQIQNEAFDKIGGLAGPVPVLFTAQPEELRTKIERDPDSFFAELNKFMARYKHSFWVKSRAIILIPSGILPFCCLLRIRILLYPHGYIPATFRMPFQSLLPKRKQKFFSGTKMAQKFSSTYPQYQIKNSNN